MSFQVAQMKSEVEGAAINCRNVIDYFGKKDEADFLLLYQTAIEVRYRFLISI